VLLTDKATENAGAHILVCVTHRALTLTEVAASAVVSEALGGSEVRFNCFSWSQRVTLGQQVHLSCRSGAEPMPGAPFS